MEAFDSYLNDLVNQNRETFSAFQDLKWLNFYQAAEAQEQRDKLTEKLNRSWLFKETKPFYNHISPGCKICGQGNWSCLFITGKCNGSCFYCPAPQLADEVPSTQNLKFETAEAYADYINFFGFKGVSFSGGEPLLFFDRTLHYLKTVRERCNPEISTWMYTNGILGDEEKFRKLADAGLNEVRFDIGATGFKLDKIGPAKGIIPNITIEIPAIPEEKEKLKQLLPEMIKAGVSNLNLHQLRLTRHNAEKLIKRGYTFIPAEQPIVLESELAALEILEFARENQLEIGINYCSFFFKNRFQKAGFRKQVAAALANPGETITEKGFIRELDQKTIGYKTITISDERNGNLNPTELKLPNKTLYISRQTALKKTSLDEEQKPELEEILKNEPGKIPADPFLFEIWQKEYIERGLREY
ncbi:MAG: radical SAM protein [Bacteroidia bacterium]|nr:radical SAM protein [Bacteroidia bacterium]